MKLNFELLKKVEEYISKNQIVLTEKVVSCDIRFALEEDFVDKDISNSNENDISLCLSENAEIFDEDEQDIELPFKSELMLKNNISKSNSLPLFNNLSGFIDNYRHQETTWSNEVLMLIDKMDVKDSKVYKRAGISRQTFSKIRTNKYYQPSRDTAIQMCIGLMLNYDQSIDLLKKAGFILTCSNARDLAVRYFLENEVYNLAEINIILYHLKLEPFKVA